MEVKTTKTLSMTIGLFECKNGHQEPKETRTRDIENEYEIPTGGVDENGNEVMETRKSYTTETLDETCSECGVVSVCKDSKFVEFSFIE